MAKAVQQGVTIVKRHTNNGLLERRPHLLKCRLLLVSQAILLSPAVSPQYDLSMPLNAVRGNMYSFNSKYDLFFLSLGTSLFGTPDGIKTKAAGCVGFHEPGRHAKLREVLWTPEMISTLHFGEHFGTSMLPWLVKYVLPILAQEVLEPGAAAKAEPSADA